MTQRPAARAPGLTYLACLLLLAASALLHADTLPEPAAQRLVDTTLAHHPEVAHLVLHVTPPGQPDTENLIIASSIGHLGKRADQDDLRILRSGTPETVVAKSGDRFNVSLPLLDATGHSIGIVAIGFPYKPGDDKAALLQAAQRLRDELKTRIPSAQSLFGPAPQP